MNDCIEDTNDPCYYRLPEHKCGRKEGDGPCIHAAEIAARRAKEREEQK